MKRLRLALMLTGCALVLPAFGLEPVNVLPAAGTIEYAFTPGDDAAGLIVRTIDSAKAQVLMQAFSFTHRDIADALIRAYRRGIDVQIMVDREQFDSMESSAMRSLIDVGLPIFMDAQHSAAHNKVVIIDGNARDPKLVTGSFNFTFAAQYRNAENVLVFRGNQELVRVFFANWQQHRAHATAMPTTQSR
jgi:phosphatidylserine/phosphatidylglycerophosphate/cardiolipin synthase-like enzyme